MRLPLFLGTKTMVMVPKVEKNVSNLQAPEGFEMHNSDPEDPCYVICTSGSTGTPKAVLIPHRAVSFPRLSLSLDFTFFKIFIVKDLTENRL